MSERPEATVPRFIPVSAVIPTLPRRRDLLDRALRSVRAQVALPAEVVIASDSDSTTTDSAALADLRAIGIRVVLVSTGGGAGPGGTRQLAADNATTDFVALLDDDDEWLPTKLAAQWALLSQHSPTDRTRMIIGSKVLLSREGRGTRSAPGRLPASPLRDYLFARPRTWTLNEFVATPALLCPASAFRTVRMSSAWPTYEDLDWLLRAEQAGYRIVSCPEPLVRVHLRGQPRTASVVDERAEHEMLWARSAGLTRRQYANYRAAFAARSLTQTGHRGRAARVLLSASVQGATPSAIASGLSVVVIPDWLVNARDRLRYRRVVSR